MKRLLHLKMSQIFLGGLHLRTAITTLIFFILLLIYSFTSQAQLTAFPGAEGFGKHTKGGRGGTIIKVTNLNASGSGSLAAALTASGPRIVVFEVSGTIELSNAITIKNPFVTIAGQTAPSPGILVKGGAIAVKTHDVLIQHIRVRAGYVNTGDDCIKISSAGTGDVYNVYLDHVSLSWAKDENLSFYQRDGRIYDISVSHCFITEALAKNGTHTGAKGFLISKDPTKSSDEIIGQFSVTKNLFAHNNQRNPNMKNGSQGILVNNLVYGYRHSAVEIGDETGEFKIANVNNCYKTRPGIDPIKPPINLRSPYTGQLYLSGNELDGEIPNQNSLLSNSLTLVNSSPLDMSVVTVLPTFQTHDYVLANAGARPVDRDAVDARIIAEVESGGGKWMDQSVVNSSYPTLAVNNRAFTISNPNGDDDGDGFTNVEELLHDMKLEVEGGDVVDPTPINNAPTISNITNKTIDENTSLNDVNFTIGDDNTPLSSLTLSGTSSNQSLANNSDIVFGGSGANRTLTVSPNTNQFGTTTITVTVSDGEKTASDTFVLTVNEVDDEPGNSAPTISSIGDITINQDESTGAISFQVNDNETAASQLTVTGVSSNQTLVNNNDIDINGNGSSKTVTVTPNASNFGDAVITLTVSDGALSASESFTLTVLEEIVDPVNTPPTISGISDKEIVQDQTLGPVNFTIGDDETNSSELVVSATSSNQSLVPNGNITHAGSGSNRSVTISPAAGQFGSTVITITVSDGEAQASASFNLDVTETIGGGNDAPYISPISAQTSPVNKTLGPVYFTVSDDETSPNQIQISASSSNTSLVGNSQMKIQSSGTTRALYLRPYKNKTGKTIITISAFDGENTSEESFEVTIGSSSNSSGSPSNGRVISNEPNPFSTQTTLSWTLETDEKVSLEIFDMRGHSVKSLVNERQTAGEHSVVWDRTTNRNEVVQDGMYIYKFRHGNTVILDRIIVAH